MMPIEYFEAYYNNVLSELLKKGKSRGIKLRAYDLTEKHHIELHGVRRFCSRDSFRAGVVQYRQKLERKAAKPAKPLRPKSDERKSRSKEFESRFNWLLDNPYEILCR